MPDGKEISEFHRDLGRLEGRVGALENALTEIKGALSKIFEKLNTISAQVATDTGVSDGKEKASGNFLQILGFVITIIVAIGTTYYLAVHTAPQPQPVTVQSHG